MFAGQDTANPPVRPGNILTSGFYTQINAAVTGLAVRRGGDSASDLRHREFVGGTSPFSAYLSQPYAALQADLPVVQVGQNQTEPVGIPASANGLIPDSTARPSPHHTRRSARLHRLLHARRAAGAGDDRFAQQRTGK